MANFRIWAPWRLAYVKDAAKDNEEQCIFCAKPAAEDDRANLIVHRGESCFVILNLFPYTNGHLMVAPYDHIGRLQEIPAATLTEMMELAQRAMDRLEERLRAARLQRRLQPGPGRRRRGRAPHPHARRPALGRRQQLHAGDRRHQSDAAIDRAELRGSGRSVLSEQPPLAPPGIFKAYDIRGLYGTEMDETTAHAIGRAFARVLGRLRGKPVAELRIGLGRDMRLTAPAMAAELRDGLIFEGATVLDAGMVGDRDALPPGRLARARRRRDGHRLAQPEGLHRREAGPRGRPAALRRRRDRRRQGRDRGRPRLRPRRRLAGGGRRLGGVPRSRDLLHRPRGDQADEGRRRRRQRDGRADGRADPRTAAAGAGGDVLRRRTASSPTTSRTRCWRRTGG